jgi:hypothetical protein
MPERSKGRDQTKFGVGCGANDLTLENFTVTGPWRGPRQTHRVVAPMKEKTAISESLCISDSMSRLLNQ